MSYAEIERALEALEARGARSFDGDGCDAVRALIARGAALPPPADAFLLERVAVHLARLDERFERAVASASEWLEVAERSRGPLPEERAAFERREFRTLRRRLRRLERTPASVRAPEEKQRCARGYEAVVAELSAQFTVARAVDEMPAHAGPYNPLRIATDLLARIGAVSPTYLTAQLRRLDELAMMLRLPEPPAPPRVAPPPKKPARRRPKRRTASRRPPA